MNADQLRAFQEPIKQRYKNEPAAAAVNMFIYFFPRRAARVLL